MVRLAIPIWDDLQKRLPQYPLYAEWQALAREARGEARAAAGPTGPAEEDFEKALLYYDSISGLWDVAS